MDTSKKVKNKGRIESIRTESHFESCVDNYYIKFDVVYGKASPGFEDRNSIRVQAIDSCISFEDFPKVILAFQNAFKYAKKLADQMPAVTLPGKEVR